MKRIALFVFRGRVLCARLCVCVCVCVREREREREREYCEKWLWSLKTMPWMPSCYQPSHSHTITKTQFESNLAYGFIVILHYIINFSRNFPPNQLYCNRYSRYDSGAAYYVKTNTTPTTRSVITITHNSAWAVHFPANEDCTELARRPLLLTT